MQRELVHLDQLAVGCAADDLVWRHLSFVDPAALALLLPQLVQTHHSLADPVVLVQQLALQPHLDFVAAAVSQNPIQLQSRGIFAIGAWAM